MKLSILIPVFNEEKTISEVLRQVQQVSLARIQKEIIVIDDGSTDTSAVCIKNAKEWKIKYFKHEQNQGKGAAIQTGIKHATGDYILIQDADLEYNPQDIKKLLAPILAKHASVVYGTRLRRLPNLKRDEKTPRFFLHYVGNRFLSLLTSLLYQQWITDMETCYKVFPRDAVSPLTLHAKRFDFEPEITAKLLKNGYRILEVPIQTTPRGISEGKKLRTVHDGVHAFLTLIKYRFLN